MAEPAAAPRRRRARHAAARTPRASRNCPRWATCSPGRPRSTSPRRPACPRPVTPATRRPATGFAPGCGRTSCTCDPGRRALTLVQCDLLAGSAVVQQLVADAVADLDVPLSGLFVGATHTHAGPGQFHGNALMNRFSSNHPGFDPAFTGWLVERIAGGGARGGHHPPSGPGGGRRHRGLGADPQPVAVGLRRATRASTRRRRRAAGQVRRGQPVAAPDPGRRRGRRADLAASVIFSVHGTGISHRDHAYNADVWAYLKGELAQHIERTTGARAVVGAVEGTHGDVAPAVRPGLLVYPEAERVGRGIGAAAAELYDRLEGDAAGRGPAGGRVPRARSGHAARRSAGITLPPPAFGAATMAGAFENTTPLIHRLPPFRPGRPKPGARGPHGAKWIPGGRRGHDLIVPPASFPSVLPVQLLRIGPLLIVGLPFEVTVESGRRVAAAVRAEVGRAAAEWRRARRRLVAGQRAVLLPDHARGVRAAALRGRQHPLRPAEPAVRDRPRRRRWRADLARCGPGRGHVSEVLPRRVFDFAAHRFLPSVRARRSRPRRSGAATFTDVTRTEDGYWEFRWRSRPGPDLARTAGPGRGGDGGRRLDHDRRRPGLPPGRRASGSARRALRRALVHLVLRSRSGRIASSWIGAAPGRKPLPSPFA